jgi:hypothetical protein
LNTPAAAHKLACALYEQCSPRLGVHVRCRAHALLALGCAAGMGLRAELRHLADQHHYVVAFDDGSISEDWWGDTRLVPPP